MTDLARKALEVALSQLGTKEDPPGSNRGPAVDEYLRAVHLDAARGHYPWCAAFVCWCVARAARELGVVSEVFLSASVAELLRLNSELQMERPEPGCVFIHLQPDGHGHTGFVEAVHDDLSFESVEGNSDSHGSRTGGQVVRQRRPAGYAQAFLRIG